MSDKIIRLPPNKHQQAFNLQQRILKENGYRIPLWRCLIEVEKGTPPDPFDAFKRLRL